MTVNNPCFSGGALESSCSRTCPRRSSDRRRDTIGRALAELGERTGYAVELAAAESTEPRADDAALVVASRPRQEAAVADALHDAVLGALRRQPRAEQSRAPVARSYPTSCARSSDAGRARHRRGKGGRDRALDPARRSSTCGGPRNLPQRSGASRSTPGAGWRSRSARRASRSSSTASATTSAARAAATASSPSAPGMPASVRPSSPASCSRRVARAVWASRSSFCATDTATLLDHVLGTPQAM